MTLHSAAHTEPRDTSFPKRPVGADVVWLDEPRATDRDVVGAKAAALARATAAGLPVVPGFVVPAPVVDALAAGADLPPPVRDAERQLAGPADDLLVVRSSSSAEDLDDSSMAGRYVSVVGVRGDDEFARAVASVVASRSRAAAESGRPGDEPFGVLVQPLIPARLGGVLFGIDPVSGREDRLVVATVTGGPDRLVSGEVDGSRDVLTPDGRRVEHEPGDGGVRLRPRLLRRLAQLAARVAEVFGGPQDVEWAVDGDRRLWLLQSRPVTAEARGRPVGPVLGPGPVAETFPEPLQPLEVDLWVPPLRSALRAALELAGTAPGRALDESPLVEVVGGRVAVDLDLLEPQHSETTVTDRLDPRPRLRRLRMSWRVGRLRAALPSLALDVVEAADRTLAGVPALAGLSDPQLVGLLQRAAPALTSVHAHEVLVGLLVTPDAPATTGTSTAMRVLAGARALGWDDDDLRARSPVVLALVPPRIGPPAALPADVPAPGPAEPAGADDAAVLREALRLRVRWLQELTARAAWTLAERWAAAGRLQRPDDVRGLRLRDLAAAVREPEPVLVPRAATPGEPLPTRFRVSDRGCLVALAGSGGPTGAGGGAATGIVYQGDDPPDGAVLVVRTLDPALAPLLPRLAGLVAETGSVLAHLAILAREQRVPTVVGYAGALDRLAPGTVVRVDGATGQVERQEARP